MRSLTRILAIGTVMLLAAPALAKGKPAAKNGFDDLFAAPGPKAKVAKVAPKGRPVRAPAPKAKPSPALVKAGFVPAPAAPVAPTVAPANMVVLADWAPDRHALAGP